MKTVIHSQPKSWPSLIWRVTKKILRAAKILGAGVLLLGAWFFAGQKLWESIQQDRVGPSYGYIYSDLQMGQNSNGDPWCGGIYFDVKADRIRRLVISKGESIDPDTKQFFARLPMSDSEFEQLITRLKSSEKSAFHECDTLDRSGLFFIPDWFPEPDEAKFVSRAREDNWGALLVRGHDGYTYVHLH